MMKVCSLIFQPDCACSRYIERYVHAESQILLCFIVESCLTMAEEFVQEILLSVQTVSKNANEWKEVIAERKESM